MIDTDRSHSGTLVAAVIFAAMIAGLIYRYWPSDERSIRRHLSNLSEALSIPTTDSDAERITRFAALQEYFAPDVRIRLDEREIAPREALMSELSQWKPPPGGLAVEFVDVNVALAADNAAATVSLTAKAATTKPDGTSSLDERIADLRMTKLAGDWVISSATLRAVTTINAERAEPAESNLPRAQRVLR